MVFCRTMKRKNHLFQWNSRFVVNSTPDGQIHILPYEVCNHILIKQEDNTNLSILRHSLIHFSDINFESVKTVLGFLQTSPHPLGIFVYLNLFSHCLQTAHSFKVSVHTKHQYCTILCVPSKETYGKSPVSSSTSVRAACNVCWDCRSSCVSFIIRATNAFFAAWASLFNSTFSCRQKEQGEEKVVNNRIPHWPEHFDFAFYRLLFPFHPFCINKFSVSYSVTVLPTRLIDQHPAHISQAAEETKPKSSRMKPTLRGAHWTRTFEITRFKYSHDQKRDHSVVRQVEPSPEHHRFSFDT